jgi:hypothetical protein
MLLSRLVGPGPGSPDAAADVLVRDVQEPLSDVPEATNCVTAGTLSALGIGAPLQSAGRSAIAYAHELRLAI